jgi:hypothetical protein
MLGWGRTFSERISSAADDTVLSALSAVVVCVVSAIGLTAAYFLARVWLS